MTGLEKDYSETVNKSAGCKMAGNFLTSWTTLLFRDWLCSTESV